MATTKNIQALEVFLSGAKVRFTFRKKNGEIREAFGTRNLFMIPEGVQLTFGERSPILPYFDLDKRERRCLRVGSLISINSVVALTSNHSEDTN